MKQTNHVSKEYMDDLTAMILDEIYQTYFMYGPGLFERVYEATLAGRIASYGTKVERQKQIFIKNEFVENEPAFYADLVVDDKVIIELKSVEQLTKLHHKQLTTYLKLTGLQVGYLVNFNCRFLKENVKRLVHNYPY
ncbi:MAG: GxxExxY protein [Bacteroidota bacterium]